MNKKYRIPLAFSMAAIWIFLICRYPGIFFETNDDRLLTEILSGSTTGFPEAHTYYIDYILGFLISSLYRLTTAVPWYGGTLVLFQFLCCFLTADAFLSRCHNKKDYFFALLFSALLYVADFYIIANIQFTSTAAILAITGYICLFLYPGEKSRYTLFFLLEFLSFELRSKAMYMIQPMGFLVFLGYYLREKSFKRRSVLRASAILLFILIIGKCSYAFFYSSPGWKEYEKINNAITEITDYAAIPDYAEVQPILEKYNVTEKQYKAFFLYTMVEKNLSGDCLTEIADVAHAKNTSPDLSQVFKQFWESYSTHDYYNLNRLLLATWTTFIIYLLIEKYFSFLFPLAGLFLSRSALWLFLLYQGRIPPRVMIPLYLGEISFLFCLFFLTILKHNPRQAQTYNGLVICLLPFFLVLLLLPYTVKTFKDQYRFTVERNIGEPPFFAGWKDIISYCNNHPEKRYFIDLTAWMYFRGSAFETEAYGPRNMVVTGGWYAGAPVLYRYEKIYFSDCNSIYLIISAETEAQSGMVINYLEECIGTSAYLEDVITVSNGNKYLIYEFSL